MESEILPSKKSKAPKIIILSILILGLIYGGIKLNHSMHYEDTDNAQIETYTTPVMSRTAGYVDSIFVEDFKEVKKGDLLLVVDDREFIIAVAQAEADLKSAEADGLNAQAAIANVNGGKSIIASSIGLQKIKEDKAKSDYLRDQNLYNSNAITSKQLDDSKINFETAEKSYESVAKQMQVSDAQISAASAQIEKAKAMVLAKAALLEQAKLKLSYTKITAPESGKTGKINLQNGQYLQPGQNLFTVVNDKEFWITANFKETQLENLQLGQEVEVTIDGFPDKEMKGKIVSMSAATGAKFALLPPDNSTGNFVKVAQRIPVRIEILEPQLWQDLLKAGLSVHVDVKVK